MKILSLNIRGFGGDVKERNLRTLISKESVDFCGIQESLLLADASAVVRMVWKHSDYGFFQVPTSYVCGEKRCSPLNLLLLELGIWLLKANGRVVLSWLC